MPVSADDSNSNEASRKRKADDEDNNPTQKQKKEAHEEESDDESLYESDSNGSSDDEEKDEDDRLLLYNRQQPKVSPPSHRGGDDRKIPSWKLDPEESFSDWTIYITTPAEQQQDQQQTTRKDQKQQDDDVYHVHRTILTCSLLKSDYFRMLFQSNFCESKTNSCRIPLAEPARKVFPLFLNLLYHPFSSLEGVPAILRDTSAQTDYLVTTEVDDDTKKNSSRSNGPTRSGLIGSTPSSYRNNLVALLYLADFFQTTELHEAFLNVIQMEPFSQFPCLYRKAAIDFSPPVQIVVDWMQDYCAKNIYSYMVFRDQSFWNAVSVDFLIAVVSSEHHLISGRMDRTTNPHSKNELRCLVTQGHHSTALSLVVANYCWNDFQQQQKQKKSGMDENYSLVTPETFRILTQKEYLPHLLFESAQKLLQLEKYYHDGDNNESKAWEVATTASSSTASGDEDELTTCLQTRCLDTLLKRHALIHTSNPSDETIKMIKSSKTLLSASATVDFMSKLCHIKVEKEQRLKTEHCQQKEALQREMKRFKLVSKREALKMGIKKDDQAGIICAPEKFLPEHLQNRVHDYPGYHFTKYSQRFLFTYEPDLPSEEEEEEEEDDEEEENSDDAEEENDDNVEEEEDSDSDNEEEEQGDYYVEDEADYYDDDDDEEDNSDGEGRALW